MGRFFCGMITGATLLYVAMHYHVIRGQEGLSLVPKVNNDFSDIYVDVREFTLSDWKNHQSLAAAILKSDNSELVSEAASRGLNEGVGSLVEGFFK